VSRLSSAPDVLRIATALSEAAPARAGFSFSEILAAGAHRTGLGDDLAELVASGDLEALRDEHDCSSIR
jgi:hypothetical protein